MIFSNHCSTYHQMKWLCYKKKCNVPTTNIRHFFAYSYDKKVASQSFATIAQTKRKYSLNYCTLSLYVIKKDPVFLSIHRLKSF